jgi:hypothetical protein
MRQDRKKHAECRSEHYRDTVSVIRDDEHDPGGNRDPRAHQEQRSAGGQYPQGTKAQ